MSLSNKVFTRLAGSLVLTGGWFSAGCFADTNLHGFLSYSFVETGAVRYLTEQPDDPSSHLLEGGLAGSYSFNDQLRASLQVIYRDFGDRYDAGLHLDYALLDWSLYGDLDTQINTQIGRFKNVRGLYNATRDVPFTRPSILLPQGIYLDAFRDPLVSTDGMRFSGNHLTGSGQYGVDIGLGKTPAPDDLDYNLLGARNTGSFSSDYHYYLDLRYEPNEEWLVAVNFGDRKFHFIPYPQSVMPKLDFDYQALVFSLQYSRQYWEFVSEYYRSWISFSSADPKFPEISVAPESWYLQLRLFPHEDWVGLLRYDYYTSNDPTISPDDKFTSTTDYTIGLTWNLSSSWMLRMEYHYMDGFAIIPPLSTRYSFEAPDHWHIFAAQIAYRF